MTSRTFLKNVATSLGLCAAGAGVIGAITGVAGGAAVATSTIVGAAALGGLATCGVVAFGNYILLPMAEFAIGLMEVFAGGRGNKPEPDRRGFGLGLVLSGTLGIAGVVGAAAQGGYEGAEKSIANTPAQPAAPHTPAFNCAANELRVEKLTIDTDGQRTLTVTCQPR